MILCNYFIFTRICLTHTSIHCSADVFNDQTSARFPVLDVVPQAIQVPLTPCGTSEPEDSTRLSTGSTSAKGSGHAIEAEGIEASTRPQPSTHEGPTIGTPPIDTSIPPSAPEPLQDPKVITPQSEKDFIHRKYTRKGKMVPGTARTARQAII